MGGSMGGYGGGYGGNQRQPSYQNAGQQMGTGGAYGPGGNVYAMRNQALASAPGQGPSITDLVGAVHQNLARGPMAQGPAGTSGGAPSHAFNDSYTGAPQTQQSYSGGGVSPGGMFDTSGPFPGYHQNATGGWLSNLDPGFSGPQTTAQMQQTQAQQAQYARQHPAPPISSYGPQGGTAMSPAGGSGGFDPGQLQQALQMFQQGGGGWGGYGGGNPGGQLNPNLMGAGLYNLGGGGYYGGAGGYGGQGYGGPMQQQSPYMSPYQNYGGGAPNFAMQAQQMALQAMGARGGNGAYNGSFY